MGTHPIFESDFDCLTEMPVRRKKSEIPEIHSEDEVSDSEPMNPIDKFHEDVDRDSESEEYSEPEGVVVADVEGRSESDDEDESDFEENEVEERYIVPGKGQLGNKLDSYMGTDYSSKE